MKTGAWIYGGYFHGQAGTLGESLASDSDNLGWAIRSWKYELRYNGLLGQMKLDLPTFGDATRTQVIGFQNLKGLTADGIIGPRTGKALLQKRIADVAASTGAPAGDLRGIVAHESGYDVGAVGQDDSADRGPCQNHLTAGGSINLSQAIRPALAIPRLAAQLRRVAAAFDDDAAVASWNVGEGGAEWWWEHKEPATGSPDWWRGATDLSARATAYVAAVRALAD